MPVGDTSPILTTRAATDREGCTGNRENRELQRQTAKGAKVAKDCLTLDVPWSIGSLFVDPGTPTLRREPSPREIDQRCRSQDADPAPSSLPRPFEPRKARLPFASFATLAVMLLPDSHGTECQPRAAEPTDAFARFAVEA